MPIAIIFIIFLSDSGTPASSYVDVACPRTLHRVLKSSLPSSPSAEAENKEAGQQFEKYASNEQDQRSCLFVRVTFDGSLNDKLGLVEGRLKIPSVIKLWAQFVSIYIGFVNTLRDGALKNFRLNNNLLFCVKLPLEEDLIVGFANHLLFSSTPFIPGSELFILSLYF